ncbi:uncharacterized protein [Battus philenor]|uniref:uncharacterized protein n=1 Tax=Battus philenor TaxID=42288 RepID=UPI0035CF45AF
MIYVKPKKIDFVLNNYIKFDTQKVILPLILVQYLTLCPKYRVCCNFATPFSLKINIFLCLLTSVIFFAYCCSFFKILFEFRTLFKGYTVYVLGLQYLLFAVSYICNNVMIVKQSEINVKLLTKLQLIRNINSVDKCADRGSIVINWIFSSGLILSYLIISYVQVVYTPTPCSMMILSVIVIMPLDVSIIYAALITKLLSKEIVTWNCQLKCTFKFNANSSEDMNMQNSKWRSILNGYFTIVDAYYLCEKIIAVPIINYVMITFLQYIMNIQIIIDVRIQSINGVIVLCVLWTSKNAFLLVLICYECEYAYITLKNAQVMCLMIPHKDNLSDFARDVCRQLQQEGKRVQQAVSALDLFVVNARLLLHFLSVVATYAVVILQFNFL